MTIDCCTAFLNTLAKKPEVYEEIWHSGEKFMGLRADLSMLSGEQVFELIIAT